MDLLPAFLKSKGLHRNIYKLCRRTFLMVYTEVKTRNQKRYYYRVISIREGNKVKKKRIYLGADLSKSSLIKNELEADKKFNSEKINKLLNKIKYKIIKVLVKNNVRKAGIFGSYARGEQKHDSDIDIIIEPPKGIGFGFVRIVYELEDKLGKKVDLLTYNGINPLLKKRIMRDEKRILNG